MLFETYDMIIPSENSIEEYKTFYELYGQNIKFNVISNQALKEIKHKIPLFSIEISQNSASKTNEINAVLYSMHLAKTDAGRDKYARSISSDDKGFIESNCNGDISLYIDFITNYQQIIIVYSIFEGTTVEYLKRKNPAWDRIFQKSIIDKILEIEGEEKFINKFNELSGEFLDADNIKALWLYYTIIRNLYNHTGGIINNSFINEIKKVSENLNKTINEYFSESLMFLQMNDDVFQLNEINSCKLFVISEINLRIFRNFLIYVWETINSLNEPTRQIENAQIINNDLSFRLLYGNEEQEILNEMPQTITSNNINYNISGYLCPRCIDSSIFLYKAKFKDYINLLDLQIIKSHDDSSYKARNVFTCYYCKSFYFPAIGELLSNNNGFNIIELNENLYLILLDIFEHYGVIDKHEILSNNLDSYLSDELIID